MNDTIKINLKIGDSNYPLTIKREDEEIIRRAAKEVNDKLNAYRAHYPNVDKERIMAMVAYQFSLENLKQLNNNDTQPYQAKIDELNDLLDDYLKK